MTCKPGFDLRFDRRFDKPAKLCTTLFVCALIVACGADTATLARHTVVVDGHPMALWEKSAQDAHDAILLVHGKTWSALPDFDLQVAGEELSLMDGLVAQGYAVYAVDLRGYGETPRDDSEWLTPNRAADDVAGVIQWIAGRHDWQGKPHLFGWSMGATISQLSVQRNPGLVASLTLFGYWRDDDTVTEPDATDIRPQKLRNTAEAAASDFITPGSISQEAINRYVEMALDADPVKVDIRSEDQYNALDASRITVPTLIIQGEHDPLGPTEYQVKLFTRLGTAHKQWVTMPGGDHAALIETPRPLFIHSLVNFMRGANL